MNVHLSYFPALLYILEDNKSYFLLLKIPYPQKTLMDPIKVNRVKSVGLDPSQNNGFCQRPNV